MLSVIPESNGGHIKVVWLMARTGGESLVYMSGRRVFRTLGLQLSVLGWYRCHYCLGQQSELKVQD